MAQPALPAQSDALDHSGPWTERDYLELREENRRIELLDGGLLVNPSPAVPHQRLAFQLQVALARAVPSELEVLQAVNVRVGPGKILIPDLAIVTNPGTDLLVCEPADVALVVDIVSPGSVAADRAVKPQLYARAGIPSYLRIEPSVPTPTAVAYRRDGERYVEASRADGNGRITLTVPLHVDLDLAALAGATRLPD